MNKTQAILKLINKINHDLPDNYDYDQLGQFVEQLADKQTSLFNIAFGEEKDKTDLIKRILFAKKQTENDEEFRSQIWGILNEDSKQAEQHLVDNIAALNDRLGQFAGNEKNMRKYRRTQKGDTCYWCQQLAGTWNYPVASNGVSLFVRHKGCDCIFEIIPANEKDNPPPVEEMTMQEFQNMKLQDKIENEKGEKNG